jgi:RHS repeat-associated protein
MGFCLTEPMTGTAAGANSARPPTSHSQSICTAGLAGPKPHRGPTSSRILSSKYRDRESYLYYYGFRCYAPEIGRWTRRDPLGVKEPSSARQFVSNRQINPVSKSGGLETAMRNSPAGLLDAIGLTWYHDPFGWSYTIVGEGTFQVVYGFDLDDEKDDCDLKVTVKVCFGGNEPPAFATYEAGVRKVWDRKLKVVCDKKCPCPNGYPIAVSLKKEASRPCLGVTIDSSVAVMNEFTWQAVPATPGLGDAVAHEVGHMLGNPDERLDVESGLHLIGYSVPSSRVPVADISPTVRRYSWGAVSAPSDPWKGPMHLPGLCAVPRNMWWVERKALEGGHVKGDGCRIVAMDGK